MVVTFFPTASPAVTPHERTAAPSMCTVQAPHCAIPHPYFVPVMPTESRITHKSGVSGSASTSCDFPLMVRRSILYPPGSDFFARVVRRQSEERKHNSLARNEQSDCAGNSPHHQKVIAAQQDFANNHNFGHHPHGRTCSLSVEPWHSMVSRRLPHI